MNNGNVYNGYGYMGNVGPVGYAAAGPENHAPKFQNALTAEEINSIRSKGEEFSLGISKDELYRGICTHRDVNGVESLIENLDGTTTCAICQKTFKLSQLRPLEVEASVDSILDILQTMKLMYLDLPPEAAREYFQIIPMIEKIPKFYELSKNNFLKHENWQAQRYNGSPNTINLYNSLAGGNLGAMYQQQMYGNPYQQPQMYGNPYQQPMNGSPFYNSPQPQQGYAPVNQGYQYQPNQQAMQQCAQPVGNIAPANSTAATDGQNVEVTATFKS